MAYASAGVVPCEIPMRRRVQNAVLALSERFSQLSVWLCSMREPMTLALLKAEFSRVWEIQFGAHSRAGYQSRYQLASSMALFDPLV